MSGSFASEWSNNPTDRVVRNHVTVWLLGLFGCLLMSQTHAVECDRKGNAGEIDALRETVERDGKNLDARIDLSDALMADGCYDDALVLLLDGEALHGGNRRLARQIREARTMVEEQQYFDRTDDIEAVARLRRSELRCLNLGDVNACNRALDAASDPVPLLLAKGDAVLGTGRSAAAVQIFGQATRIDPDDQLAQRKLENAEAQRRASVRECLEGNDASSTETCQQALLRGASDEFGIRKRMAQLAQLDGRPAEALSLYGAAHQMQPDDQAVAEAVIALSDTAKVSDAVNLTTLGSALLHTGQPRGALRALDRALALDDSLVEARALFEEAQTALTRARKETPKEPPEQPPEQPPRQQIASQAMKDAKANPDYQASRGPAGNARPLRYSNDLSDDGRSR